MNELGSTIWWKGSETPVNLANFSAKIVADRVVDDGAETRREFDIEALLDKGKRVERATVSASTFNAMTWPSECFGSAAVVNPNSRDHLRAAVQVLSPRIVERKVYGHIGWRSIDGAQVYLHAGGGIGEKGLVKGIETQLAPEIERFRLPAPPAQPKLRDLAAASLALLDAASDEITVPLFGSIWRAALGGSTCSLFLSGLTGSGKSELAALAQQHWGPALHAKSLPACWFSTANAIELLAFQAKDALLTIDDFVPTGAAGDVSRLHSMADRILRSQGNLSTRQRLTAELRLRASKPARGMILSTGEDVPRGQSLRARLVVVDVGPNALDFGKLTSCQKSAAGGDYAAHLAGFVRWLAPRQKSAADLLQAELVKFRSRSVGGQHRRTPDNISQLAGALRVWLNFATESKAITERAAAKLWKRFVVAFDQLIAVQEQQQESSDPVKRYIEMLRSVVRTGRAHLVAPNGGAPENGTAWGWRDEKVALGQKIGWIDGDDVYLEPNSAYAAVRQFGFETGESVALQSRTLHQRLEQRGLLASTEPERLLVRRVLEGQRHYVLHFLAPSLLPDDRTIRTNRTTEDEFKTEPIAKRTNRTTKRTTATDRKTKTSGEMDQLVQSDEGGEAPKESWERTRAALDAHFPGAADDQFIERLAAAAREALPDCNDEAIAIAVTESVKRSQQSIGLFLRTVPARLRWKGARFPKPSAAVEKAESCERCWGTGVVGTPKMTGEKLSAQLMTGAIARDAVADGWKLCSCPEGKIWADYLSLDTKSA